MKNSLCLSINIPQQDVALFFYTNAERLEEGDRILKDKWKSLK